MTQSQSSEPRPESENMDTGPGTARLSTVLASVPGVAEQSLRAALESLASVEIVGTAAGCLSAMHMLRDRQTDLIVLDANLPFDDVRLFLQQLEQDGLATHALVLTATSRQVREALAAGADVALRRDATIQQLSNAVDRLYCARPGEAQEVSGQVHSGR